MRPILFIILFAISFATPLTAAATGDCKGSFGGQWTGAGAYSFSTPPIPKDELRELFGFSPSPQESGETLLSRAASRVLVKSLFVDSKSNCRIRVTHTANGSLHFAISGLNTAGAISLSKSLISNFELLFALASEDQPVEITLKQDRLHHNGDNSDQ